MRLYPIWNLNLEDKNMNRRGYSDDDNDERMVMIDADALGWLPQQVVDEYCYELNLPGAHFLHGVGEDK